MNKLEKLLNNLRDLKDSLRHPTVYDSDALERAIELVEDLAKDEPSEAWHQVGSVGVDAGMVMLCDPCYIRDEWTSQQEDEKLHDDKYTNEFSYRGCCSTMSKNNKAGQLNYKMGHAGAGVVVSSGYGDGYYPVYVTYADGGERVAEVKVVFI